MSYFTIIHCDGGARPNPGEAAYAAILQHGGRIACVRGYAPHATNNQMELAAAIAALHTLKSSRIPVKVVVDSQYVQAGASRWIKTWRKNGWMTSRGEPVENRELWQELDAVMSRFVIDWIKVEGHADSLMNNRADDLVWDTRQAEGDSTRYQIVDIPTLESPWSFVGFERKQAERPIPPQAKVLGQHFQAILYPGASKQ
jgi:ribonuclease HI